MITPWIAIALGVALVHWQIGRACERCWSRPSNLRDSRGRTDCNQTAQMSVLTVIALCVGAIALSYLIWAIATEH